MNPAVHIETNKVAMRYTQQLDTATKPVVQQSPMEQLYSNTCRRSASMESIPSQKRLVIHMESQQPQQQPQLQPLAPTPAAHQYQAQAQQQHRSNHVINVYNKYGTVGAYYTTNNSTSGTSSSRPTNHLRPSLLMQPSMSMSQPQQQPQHAESSTANSNNHTTNFNNTSSNIADAQTNNSRFRAVNRSFRTAVDKSFDLPPNQPSPNGKLISSCRSGKIEPFCTKFNNTKRPIQLFNQYRLYLHMISR